MNQRRHPTLRPPRADDPLGVWQGCLDNGLTVLMSVNDEQPRVAVRVVVRAGAAQEPRSHTGLAHYLEHMLANKGTSRLGTVDFEAERAGLARIAALYEVLRETDDGGAREALSARIARESAAIAPHAVPNELKQLHGRLGSRSLNAFTSPDQTSYVVDVPASRLPAWALADGDRFAGPVFRSFQTEVETVCEEKKRALDDPDKELYQAMMGALFAGHPYADPVLGRSEHLESPSPTAMEAFHRRWYVPDNMAVVLAGDLDPADALDLIEEAFGALAGGPVGPVGPLGSPLPPLPRGEQRLSIAHRAPPALRIGWRTVPHGHPDALALDLLEHVLHNDSTGVLDQLVLAEKVRSCGCWHRARRESGIFCLWARPRAEQSLETLQTLVLDALQRVRDGELEPGRVRGVVANLAVDERVQMETNRGRVQMMAEAFAAGLDPAGSGTRLEAQAALGVPEVVAAARRWLGEDRVVVHRTDGEPTGRAPRTSPLPPLPPGAQGHSTLFAEALALPATDPAPRLLREGRDYFIDERPGLRVVCGPNPHNDLVRMTLRWPLGWAEVPGLDVALNLGQRAGVVGLPREALERALYEAAGTTELSAGRWTTDLAVTAPRGSLDEVLQLALARTRRPVLSPDDGRAALLDLVARRQQAQSLQSHAVAALSAWVSRGEDSVYLRRTPAEQLLAMSDQDPAERAAALIDLRATVLATGPISAAEWHERVPGGRLGVQAPAQDFVRCASDRILLLHHPSVQAQVTVTSPQGPFDAADYGPRRLWAEAMAGAAGLVFQEVREKRGMAYSAQAGISVGWRAGDANLAWMRVGTQVGKAADVVALLLHLLRAFPADAARLSRVRQSTRAQRITGRIGFRGVPGTVEDWRGKGIESDPLLAHLAALESTDDAAVRAYGLALGARPVTIAIVGDLTALDRDALRGVAPVTELQLSDLEVL